MPPISVSVNVKFPPTIYDWSVRSYSVGRREKPGRTKRPHRSRSDSKASLDCTAQDPGAAAFFSLTYGARCVYCYVEPPTPPPFHSFPARRSYTSPGQPSWTPTDLLFGGKLFFSYLSLTKLQSFIKASDSFIILLKPVLSLKFFVFFANSLWM